MITQEEVGQRLVQSRLLSQSDLDAQRARWQAGGGGTAEQFVNWLVEQERLTDFQGFGILTGNTGPFVLGPYEVYEHLAVGRLGGVFRGLHKEFQQPVSLKIFSRKLNEDPEKLARMGREARIFAELDNPHVVRSFQVGEVGSIYYLAMEDLKGETLAARLERDGSLPYKTAFRICGDVARGLVHLHENDVIHRDLRPGSIWLSESGPAKVMEFGAARDALAYADSPGESDGELTTDQTELGDYHYMSPEQAGDVRAATTASDLYALGCVLYHCLTGRPPFADKNPVRIVLRHATEMPAPPSSLAPDVLPAVDDTVLGMLAKQPQERFQSAQDVVFALDQFADPVAEQVVVIPVSDEYLAWVRESQPADTTVSPDAVGVSPELMGFLNWTSARDARRKANKARKQR